MKKARFNLKTILIFLGMCYKLQIVVLKFASGGLRYYFCENDW